MTKPTIRLERRTAKTGDVVLYQNKLWLITDITKTFLHKHVYARMVRAYSNYYDRCGYEEIKYFECEHSEQLFVVVLGEEENAVSKRKK